MLYLLLGVGAVAGLVVMAIRDATGPSKKVAADREKLERLKLRKVLTLDEAEDGLVLSRRFGEKNWEKKFAVDVTRLKKKRVPV